MTTKAKQIIDATLTIEGGYANVKGDRGGETYCGISRKNWPKWSGWSIVDKNKPLKWNQKINNLQLQTLVEEFYLTNFYNTMKIDSFDSLLISAHLYDHAVNSGCVGSVKLLQQAINKVCKVNIVVDGKIGQTTISYANGVHKDEIAKELGNQRIQRYKDNVAKNPSQKQFLTGWLNRVQDTIKKFG
jgi:lysozyme family protein